MDKKKIKKLAAQAKMIMDRLESQKVLYSQLDEITQQLVEVRGAKKILSENGLEIVDNFKDKNVVFRPAAVRKFELKRSA